MDIHGILGDDVGDTFSGVTISCSGAHDSAAVD